MKATFPTMSTAPLAIPSTATHSACKQGPDGRGCLGALCCLMGAHDNERNLGSQPYSLSVVPAKCFVGGFTGGHWFITSP